MDPFEAELRLFGDMVINMAITGLCASPLVYLLPMPGLKILGYVSRKSWDLVAGNVSGVKCGRAKIKMRIVGYVLRRGSLPDNLYRIYYSRRDNY